MASYTSWRCTEISMGAAIPNRTLSPRISTTVMTMSSPMMILSSRCRDRTSISGSFLLPTRPVTVPDHVARALGYHDGAVDEGCYVAGCDAPDQPVRPSLEARTDRGAGWVPGPDWVRAGTVPRSDWRSA